MAQIAENKLGSLLAPVVDMQNSLWPPCGPHVTNRREPPSGIIPHRVGPTSGPKLLCYAVKIHFFDQKVNLKTSTPITYIHVCHTTQCQGPTFIPFFTIISNWNLPNLHISTAVSCVSTDLQQTSQEFVTKRFHCVRLCEPQTSLTWEDCYNQLLK